MSDTGFQNAGAALEVSDEISTLTMGASMRPMLRQHRDVVVIKRVDRPFKKGDVVLYPGGNGSFTLHRIISIKNGQFIIRGDHNDFTEYDIKSDDIVGILKEFYLDGKYINCDKSIGYKLYTFYIMYSFTLRMFWRKHLKPLLSKCKRLLFKIIKPKDSK